MKKSFSLLVCFAILMTTMFGCQNQSTKKIENTIEIVIGYLPSSYVAVIKDQDEIKMLEDLFNGAEFTKYDEIIIQPYLTICFQGKKSSTLFYIDDKDVIQSGDGNYVKSKQIHFKELYSIFNDYHMQKK